MTEEVRNLLNRDGFAVVRDFFDKKIIKNLLSDVEMITKAQYTHYFSKRKFPSLEDMLIEITRKDPKLYLKTLSAIEMLWSISSIGSAESLINLSKEMGITVPNSPVRPAFHTYHFLIAKELKRNNFYEKTPLHQDWPALRSSFNTLVYWIPLTKITSRTSRVSLIPGSHKKGLVQAKEHAFGHAIDENTIGNLNGFISPTLNVGDVLVFSAFTIHKTHTPKETNDLRFAVGIRHANTLAEEFIREGLPRSYKIVMDMDRNRALNSEEISQISF